ncbi:uncharacterized protein [Nicotiana tomentosiformis]|uniref:uncharacterized protein n=1 Tax=Nicotiana tomentosiformis TaxID=4098 RepID=UPI00388CBFEA
MVRPIHLALSAASGAPATTRPVDPYYAPLVSSVPPVRGASNSQSSRSGPIQSHQPRPSRAYFECGNTRHLVRDCPIFRRGAPPQISQAPRALPGPHAMITVPTTIPHAHPARDGGWTGSGRPKGEGKARYYALPATAKVVASDSVIISIVPVYHRDASVLFDPCSTYSYVSSYFASYLGVFRDSLSSPVYVSTPVGDSIVVDCVYRSFLIVRSGFETRADLLLLSMVDFNVIFGMD